MKGVSSLGAGGGGYYLHSTVSITDCSGGSRL